MELLDFVVVGCVAVTRAGGRTGKGGGFADLELGIFRELGKVDANTQIATTVHSSQVVEDARLPMLPHDSALHFIATENELIDTKTTIGQPKGRRLGPGPAGSIREYPVPQGTARDALER